MQQDVFIRYSCRRPGRRPLIVSTPCSRFGTISTFLTIIRLACEHKRQIFVTTQGLRRHQDHSRSQEGNTPKPFKCLLRLLSISLASRVPSRFSEISAPICFSFRSTALSDAVFVLHCLQQGFTRRKYLNVYFCTSRTEFDSWLPPDIRAE